MKRFFPALAFNALWLLFCVSLSACLFELSVPAYEKYLRFKLISRSEHMAQAARAIGAPYDERAVWEVLAQERSAGKQILPRAQPFPTLAPLLGTSGVVPLGWVSKKNLLVCQEGEGYVQYESDEHGFRNPPGRYQTPVDLMLIGDSFTEGFCVNDQHTIAAHLEKKFPRTLNMGQTRYGPLRELAVLREYGPAMRPKIVLWFFSGTIDFQELIYESSIPFMRQYLENPKFSQNLFNRQTEIDALITKRIQIFERGPTAKGEPPQAFEGLTAYLLAYAKLNGGPGFSRFLEFPYLKQRLGITRERESKFGNPDLIRVLKSAAAEVSQWNGKIFFVYLPLYFNPQPGFLEQNPNDPVYQPALTSARLAGIPVIDAYDAFKRETDAARLFPFRTAGHYNADGYRLVAEKILQELQ